MFANTVETKTIEDADIILLNLDSAVEIVARTIKLLKVLRIFEKFFETVLPCTVKKIFQKS